MDIETINRAEKKWLTTCFDYCRALFSRFHLSSHDHTHHHRVWLNAKQLLHELAESGITLSDELTEGLLLASFFHDTGMTVTLDVNHGVESRKIFHGFMERNNQALAFDPETVGKAIQYHDNKEYRDFVENKGNLEPQILPLLSIADDLDAFSYMGIFRYAEIYLLRGIKPEELPARVVENIDNRFRNFFARCSGLSRLATIQYSRFRITEDYFRDLKHLLSRHAWSRDEYAGSFGVLNTIIDYIENKEADFEEQFTVTTRKSHDEYVKKYLSGILNDYKVGGR